MPKEMSPCACVCVEVNLFKHKLHDFESHKNNYIMLVCIRVLENSHTFVDFHFIINAHIHEWRQTNANTHTLTLVAGNTFETCQMCVCPDAPACVFKAFTLSVFACLPLWHCLSVVAFACLSVCLYSYLLQIASASSEPSAHSGSPSQRHRAGTHCPFLQAKSVVAHVFFAVETKVTCNITVRLKER